ncbi:MAG: hypothetical protein Q8865_07305 [Bacillota bacterium]|nr:hypothetical protein [Bacillota bacterium]
MTNPFDAQSKETYDAQLNDYPLYPEQYSPYQYEETIAPMIRPNDPPPLLSNNPASASISLFKELTAYANYGNPSRNADILYTGNQGTWTFDLPAFLFVPGNLRARIIIRSVLDDHYTVPVTNYSARITINGIVVHNGRVPLEHGTPARSIFTNWRDLPFNITNLRRNNRITIQNTSSAGVNDWIAFDWMEIRFLPR